MPCRKARRWINLDWNRASRASPDILKSASTATDPEPAESMARLELRALRKMIGARCTQIERLLEQALPTGERGSRERDFQYEVFAERRAQARERLELESDEPAETLAARLERILQGLECSWDYFGRQGGSPADDAESGYWEIRVR